MDSSRGVLRHYQKQLFHFPEMTIQDIDDMHRVLTALKEEELAALGEKGKLTGEGSGTEVPDK